MVFLKNIRYNSSGNSWAARTVFVVAALAGCEVLSAEGLLAEAAVDVAHHCRATAVAGMEGGGCVLGGTVVAA